ncbi:MAG: hypothetical protein N2663_01065 [Chlorobi bacterium]|nr:hypothetical protein [Chlorobiota bacterium]
MRRIPPVTEHVLGGAWVAERRVLGRLVRMAFALAGMMWLPLVLVEIQPSERQSFSLVQYQVYLLLLTLWGYDFRRQLRRAECVLALARAQNVSPQLISWNDVVAGGYASLFDVLCRRHSSRGWFAVTFTWCLLVGSYALVGRQIVRIISIIVG